MKYDYSKLRGKIVEKYKTISQFAKEIGISERTLSLKLNNQRQFKQSEIEQCRKSLGLKDSEIQTYFFTKKVQAN